MNKTSRKLNDDFIGVVLLWIPTHGSVCRQVKNLDLLLSDSEFT